MVAWLTRVLAAPGTRELAARAAGTIVLQKGMVTSIGQYAPVFLPGEPPSLTEKPGRAQSAAAAAAVAKSLQSCLTLCYPIDSSPTGSSIPRILQARTLEWVAISFSDA